MTDKDDTKIVIGFMATVLACIFWLASCYEAKRAHAEQQCSELNGTLISTRSDGFICVKDATRLK